MKKDKRSWSGAALLVVVVGVLILLGNLKILQPLGAFRIVVTYWPCLVIGAGIARVIGEKDRRLWAGMVLIVLGAFLQLLILDWIPLGFGNVWPIASILAGCWFLFGRRGKSAVDAGSVTKSCMDIDELFGARKFTFDSGGISSGKIEATASSLTVEFSPSATPVQRITVDIDGLLSKVTFRVPPQWRVSFTASLAAARFKDKRAAAPPEASRTETELLVTGRMNFGKILIESF
jgi:hypothetical protein